MFPTVALLSILFSTSYSLLDFSVTLDKRIRNDIGQINPISFGRGTFSYLSQFANRTFEEKWIRYTNYLSANYGLETGMLIQELSIITLDIGAALPDEIKYTVSKLLNHINYDRINFGRINDLAENITTALKRDKAKMKQIGNKFEKEWVPLSERLFFNPFDTVNLSDKHSLPINFTLFC